jgi:hypothetical protein
VELHLLRIADFAFSMKYEDRDYSMYASQVNLTAFLETFSIRILAATKYIQSNRPRLRCNGNAGFKYHFDWMPETEIKNGVFMEKLCKQVHWFITREESGLLAMRKDLFPNTHYGY